jgi:hypothetical protein
MLSRLDDNLRFDRPNPVYASRPLENPQLNSGRADDREFAIEHLNVHARRYAAGQLTGTETLRTTRKLLDGRVFPN